MGGTVGRVAVRVFVEVDVHQFTHVDTAGAAGIAEHDVHPVEHDGELAGRGLKRLSQRNWPPLVRPMGFAPTPSSSISETGASGLSGLSSKRTATGASAISQVSGAVPRLAMVMAWLVVVLDRLSSGQAARGHGR